MKRAVLLALAALLAPGALAGADLPRLLSGPVEFPWRDLGFPEHEAWCVANEPEVPPGPLRSFHDQHCPAVPGALLVPIRDVRLQPMETRVLRVIVDMDAAYVDGLTRGGRDAIGTTTALLEEAGRVLLDEVAVRLAVVELNRQPAGANYTAQAGRVHYDEYLRLARDHWVEGPAHDVVLVLTGHSLGPPGVGKIGTAGHPELVHAAYVKESYSTVARECLPVTPTTCMGPDRDRWMVMLILHEVTHTMSNRHEYATCGAQDREIGCTIMMFSHVAPAQRALEFSEIEEFYIRAHAETHLPTESEVTGLLPLN